MEPEGSLPHSQKPTNSPNPNLDDDDDDTSRIIGSMPFLLYGRRMKTEKDKTVCSHCVVKRFSATRTNAYLIILLTLSHENAVENGTVIC